MKFVLWDVGMSAHYQTCIEIDFVRKNVLFGSCKYQYCNPAGRHQFWVCRTLNPERWQLQISKETL